MTLSAVIIILREVLEAALVLSLLVSTTRLMGLSYRGILAGFVLGVAGAVGATLLVDVISASFDGVGQEVFNAVITSYSIHYTKLYDIRHGMGRYGQ